MFSYKWWFVFFATRVGRSYLQLKKKTKNWKSKKLKESYVQWEKKIKSKNDYVQFQK